MAALLAANPGTALQLADTLVRVVTAGALYGNAAHGISHNKRLRSAVSEMPFFGPSKKQRTAIYKDAMRVSRTRQRQSLKFGGTHVFRRTVGIPFTYSSLNGMQTGALALSKGLAFGVALDGITVTSNGGQVEVAVPGATDLQGLFDAYRVKSVKFVLMTSNNSSSVGGLVNGLPILCSACDANDSVAPTTRDELTPDSTFRVSRLDDTHTWTRTVMRPTTTTKLAEGTTNPTEVPNSGWIPTSNTTAYYPVLKMFSEPTGTAATATANMFMYVTVVLEFKDYK